jgi:hypothetical protein
MRNLNCKGMSKITALVRRNHTTLFIQILCIFHNFFKEIIWEINIVIFIVFISSPLQNSYMLFLHIIEIIASYININT